MSQGSTPQWLEELKSKVSLESILHSSDQMESYTSDKWFARGTPEVVVLAQSRDEVVEVMKIASKYQIPVTSRGSGVGYVGGCVPQQGGIVLSLEKMNRILEISPADGVAVVQPGVITYTLQEEVKKVGLMYPPDPASLKECSLGGNLATNAGGPRCLKYGVTRHYVLGLEVVLADGRVLRSGGRCHKNKTGFDLIGMFVGSEGMLGVITEATLRLVPHPSGRSMLSVGFETFSEAAAAVQAILTSGFYPSALEITDRFTLQAAREYKGEDLVPDGEAHLLVELDGLEETVQREAEILADFLKARGAGFLKIAKSQEECDEIWALRREFSYSLRATGLIKLNEDVVVPRGKLVDLVEFAQKLQEESGFPIACFGHAGDGNIHTNIMVPDMSDPIQKEKAEEALDRLFMQILEWGGAITGEHGVGLAKKRWFKDAVSATSYQTHLDLKSCLDPLGILNPGKFLLKE